MATTKMATKNAPARENDGGQKETKKMELIKSQELKPKQTFVNLETGTEESIEVKSLRYELVPFSGEVAKHFDGDKNAFFHEAFKQAAGLVQPVSEQVEAFLKYATSDSYQEGKKTALSAGNYLSPELKSRISAHLGNLTAFSELSAKERFERWLQGYKEKKPGAIKVLERVTESEEAFSDF